MYIYTKYYLNIKENLFSFITITLSAYSMRHWFDKGEFENWTGPSYSVY